MSTSPKPHFETGGSMDTAWTLHVLSRVAKVDNNDQPIPE